MPKLTIDEVRDCIAKIDGLFTSREVATRLGTGRQCTYDHIYRLVKNGELEIAREKHRIERWSHVFQYRKTAAFKKTTKKCNQPPKIKLSVNEKTTTIENVFEPKPADVATGAMRGTREKVEVMARRAALGMELWHPDDAGCYKAEAERKRA